MGLLPTKQRTWRFASFCISRESKKKKSKKKSEKSKLARKTYEANKLKDKTDNILIDDNIGKSLVK